MNEFVLVYIVIISILSFLLFGIDKHRARNRKRRIPELTLLLITLIGGSAGSLIGMTVFRHKTSKKPFLMKLGAIVILQIIILAKIFLQ